MDKINNMQKTQHLSLPSLQPPLSPSSCSSSPSPLLSFNQQTIKTQSPYFNPISFPFTNSFSHLFSFHLNYLHAWMTACQFHHTGSLNKNSFSNETKTNAKNKFNHEMKNNGERSNRKRFCNYETKNKKVKMNKNNNCKIKNEEKLMNSNSTLKKENNSINSDENIEEANFESGNEIKIDNYKEKRRKNNEAAKKSRDQKRIKEDAIAVTAKNLRDENLSLKRQLILLKGKAKELKEYVSMLRGQRP